MVNVTRYARFDDAINQLFRGYVVQPLNVDEQESAAKFRVDVTESDTAYTLRAELPGVKKDDIKISVEGDQISISAETVAQKEVTAGERVLRTERYAGKYYRAFTLANAVDEDATSARYVDGVLELTLPKKLAAAAKRITIQ